MSDVLLIADSAPPASLIEEWLRAEVRLTALMAPTICQQIEGEHQVSLEPSWTLLTYSAATEENIGRVGDWIRQNSSPSLIVLCLTTDQGSSAEFAQRSNSELLEFVSTKLALPIRLLHMALSRWPEGHYQILAGQPSCTLSRARNDWWSALLSELSDEYTSAKLSMELVSD